MGGVGGLGAALLAGFLFRFTPVAFTSIPVALGGAWTQNLLSRQWGIILGPFLIVLGLLWSSWLESLYSLERWRRAFEMLGGITLMLVGVYLLNTVYFWI